jgi:DNA-binding protein WhiA
LASFSAKAKKEMLCIENGSDMEIKAELGAMLRLAGFLALGKNMAVRLNTDNPAVARRIFTLIKKLYNEAGEIIIRNNTKLGRRHSYTVQINGAELSKRVLEDTYLLGDGLREDIDPGLVSSMRCKGAFLRGAFLAAGSVSNPEKRYHLEITSSSAEFASALAMLLNEMELNAKIVSRKKAYVVYLKEGEMIADFLTAAGAHSAILEFHNVRILKDIRNNINRAVNCETANIQKTVNAAARQVENIKYIEKVLGISSLPVALREVASARLDNPEASLRELCTMLSQEIGRSGVNHRLRRLDAIAEKLREERGE